jgi:hypothetical protein
MHIEEPELDSARAILERFVSPRPASFIVEEIINLVTLLDEIEEFAMAEEEKRHIVGLLIRSLAARDSKTVPDSDVKSVLELCFRSKRRFMPSKARRGNLLRIF